MVRKMLFNRNKNVSLAQKKETIGEDKGWGG